MKIKVRCLKCNETYFCTQLNTRISGPIITTTCSVCGETIVKNYSAFLDAQTKHIMEGKVVKHNEKAITMITMARAISSIISNEKSFKKKK